MTSWFLWSQIIYSVVKVRQWFSVRGVFLWYLDFLIKLHFCNKNDFHNKLNLRCNNLNVLTCNRTLPKMWKASVVDPVTSPDDVRARVVVTAYPPFLHTKLTTTESGMNCSYKVQFVAWFYFTHLWVEISVHSWLYDMHNLIMSVLLDLFLFWASCKNPYFLSYYLLLNNGFYIPKYIIQVVQLIVRSASQGQCSL